MTTWLPALIIVWVALCAVIGLTEPMFNSNSPSKGGGDWLLGGIVGLVFGIVSGAVIYALVRLGVWLAGGGV
ncbi:hypothetical protein [Halomonas lysinitropha]|uniref:Uncharacterized protein n=1 Tax=Halomonas lysinitropha TaxID=2607506 RepID=A0A5K1I4Q1_9GAMM|nr:hypothetical protein [Halomonas lysinitropha]VVZ96456.1 hypothetical protein HALO32_02556 [Halomonas lysinitropha]